MTSTVFSTSLQVHTAVLNLSTNCHIKGFRYFQIYYRNLHFNKVILHLGSVVLRRHRLSVRPQFQTSYPPKRIGRLNATFMWAGHIKTRATKVCFNGPLHVTRWPTCQYLVNKNVKISFSRTEQPMSLKLGMQLQHWELECYQFHWSHLWRLVGLWPFCTKVKYGSSWRKLLKTKRNFRNAKLGIHTSTNL